MPQCTRSSFSKSQIAAFVLLAILLEIAAAQSQTTAAATPPETAQRPTELDGQVGKTLEEMKRKLNKLKANAAQANANIPQTELAKQAADFALDPRHALSLYVVTLANHDRGISSSAVHATNSVKTETDEARVDKQTGSDSSNSGSTSLTTHGSVPAILAFAVENGALQKSVNGTAITFRARPVQVIQALQRSPFYDAYAQIQDNGTLSLLNRLSFAITFDTARGTSSGTLTASANQVSSFSTRVDLYNHRDPRDKKYKPRWDSLQKSVAQEMALSLYNAFDALTSDAIRPTLTSWIDGTIAALVPLLVDGKDDELAATLKERLMSFPQVSGKVPGADAALKQFATASAAVQTARQNIFTYMDSSLIATFEYTDNIAAQLAHSQMKLPDSSKLNFILEKGLKGGGSVTSNLSATIFNSKPTGVVANQLRDLQAAFQLDIPANTSFAKIGNVVASFSGKYEHIPSDSLVGLVSGVIPIAPDGTLKGNLGIGQAKITFPIKGSGVKIPLSISWANRTELIKENEVRGNIGITLDLDTIVSKLKD
jgi:hypothetical protein